MPGTGHGAGDAAASTVDEVPVLSLLPSTVSPREGMTGAPPPLAVHSLASFWPSPVIILNSAFPKAALFFYFKSSGSFFVIALIIFPKAFWTAAHFLFLKGNSSLPFVHWLCLAKCPFPLAPPHSGGRDISRVLSSSHFSLFCTFFLYILRTSPFLFFASPGQPPL